MATARKKMGITELFASHEERDTQRFEEAANRDVAMDAKLDKMLNNHLHHMENDMWWIKWLVIGLVTGVGGIFATVLAAIAVKYLVGS